MPHADVLVTISQLDLQFLKNTNEGKNVYFDLQISKNNSVFG